LLNEFSSKECILSSSASRARVIASL